MDIARKSPRSLEGKASGSPSALIATYCAVHFPMPEISQSRVSNNSESVPAFKADPATANCASQGPDGFDSCSG